MVLIFGGDGVKWCDCCEIAEMEALVEALNAALTLNLKGVAFLCDDLILYLYVSCYLFHIHIHIHIYIYIYVCIGIVLDHHTQFTGAETIGDLEVSGSLLNQLDILQTKFVHW
uniref:Uncharacterized protein n=1 Tax=Davidia involucrata TaxID=16924 RepID=A0A5B7B2T3_DAVIN